VQGNLEQQPAETSYPARYSPVAATHSWEHHLISSGEPGLPTPKKKKKNKKKNKNYRFAAQLTATSEPHFLKKPAQL
jgi:hypothetical protein